MWYWDEATKVPSWDGATREMFGVPPNAEITLEAFYKTLHPNDLDRVKQTWRHALDSATAYQIELRVQRPDGSICWIHARGRGYQDDTGKPTRMIGIVFEITERKQAEAELQMQRTELAAEPANLSEVRDILADIVEDDSRAGDVIRRMRALIKKEELEFVPLDVGAVIGDVVLLAHSNAILRNIRLSHEINPYLRHVRGDRVQLQQVLLNLLLNAFDAMHDCPPNKRDIHVRAARDGGRMVEITVADHGAGLTVDKLEKIFQPFYTTKRDVLLYGADFVAQQ